MFNQGLSLEQAPPIDVPFRFFITAPLFAILISIVILSNDSSLIMNRYSNIAISVVHLFTLGVLSMVIIGAMQQMMPVLAGAVIKRPKIFATIIHLFLSFGTLFFSFYFIFDIKYFLNFATIYLAIGFFSFFIFSMVLLFKVKFVTPTVKAMRIFTIVGIITICLGLYLSMSHINLNITQYHYNIVNIHILFGIFGFALIIIMGVSFQVIPMFYVAKNFPKFIENKLPILLVSCLILFSIIELLNLDITIVKLLVVFSVLTFAYYGLDSLNNRKRPIFDVTLLYWKFCFYSLSISMFIWLFLSNSSYLLAISIGLGFLYSLLQGMIYKIVPFLCWFHLTSKGYFNVPTMRELIVEDRVKIQFFIYISSILFFVLAFYISEIFLYIGAIIFIVSNLLFLLNILLAIKKYKEITKTNPMDISAFN
jgi:hypothetical protein